jgi:hypothetical protein
VEPSTGKPVAPSRAPKTVAQSDLRPSRASGRTGTTYYSETIPFVVRLSNHERYCDTVSRWGEILGKSPRAGTGARFEGLIKSANRPIWFIPVAVLISIRRSGRSQLIWPVTLLRVKLGCVPLGALAVSVKLFGEITLIVNVTPAVGLKPTVVMAVTVVG